MESGMEIATTIPKGSSRLLQYEFPSEGMTVKVDVTQGNLLVRGSFNIQNPNVLTQDFSVMSNGNNIDYFISPELFRQSTTDNDGRRTKRQAPTPTNATNGNLYLSIVGLNDNNTFVLNTTFGDTTESIKSSGKRICTSLKVFNYFFSISYKCSELNDICGSCLLFIPTLDIDMSEIICKQINFCMYDLMWLGFYFLLTSTANCGLCFECLLVYGIICQL